MQESIFFSFSLVLIAIFFEGFDAYWFAVRFPHPMRGLEFVSPAFFCFSFFQVKRNTCCGFFARFYFYTRHQTEHQRALKNVCATT